MSQNPLDVAQGHLRVPRHPVGRRMPEVVQGPVRAQLMVSAREHRPRRVIRQWPQRFPVRPPQRVIRPRWRRGAERDLVEAQPDEGVRAGRQLLHRP